jgi:hypothetical protein
MYRPSDLFKIHENFQPRLNTKHAATLEVTFTYNYLLLKVTSHVHGNVTNAYLGYRLPGGQSSENLV